MRILIPTRPMTLLLALMIARGIRADEHTKNQSNIGREISWARATWPDAFRGVRFHSPLPKLLAWVHLRGRIPVYLYTEDFACRRASLQRAPLEHNLEHGAVAFTAKIIGRVRVESGQKTRNVIYVLIGEELWREEEDITESKSADGRWRMASSSGYGFETAYGALSYVDDRVARFNGERLVMHPYCAGPVEWLSCASGGERPCVRCEIVNVTLTPPLSLFGHSSGHGDRQVTCVDPCPRYESSDIGRLQQLEEHVSLWRSSKAAIAVAPSVYESYEDCLREHPQLLRPGSGR